MAVAESVADPGLGNMHAITLSRSGKDPFQIIKLPQSTKDNLRHQDKPFDVRESQETISASLKAISPSVVVYAASASRQGGNAFAVDDDGVEKVAQACKEIGAIFVFISALAVDRPESKSFQITNTLGGNYQGIMDAKYNGEVKTRKIFASAKSDYVIVRPGVLLNGKTTTGPMGLELNQGDTIGGGLSRDELAGVVVGAIQNRALALANKSKKGVEGITVEAYRKSTAQKLEKKYTIPSGNELTVGGSKAEAPSSQNGLYRELFASAKLD
jgi:dTDP-4-dehydrorhamnose reductase